MKRFKLVLTTGVIIVAVLLAGCAAGGVPQGQYDSLNSRLEDAQAELSRLQSDVSDLQKQKEAADAALAAAQQQSSQLQGQVSGLKEQYELKGATPADTAANIVRYYHETHIYSVYDLFVCSDMSAEVWNILKAQGINAIVAVGKIDANIADIVQSDHAWVLAEVAPGQLLALETTGGRVVPREQNALYYRGWTFASLAELKKHNDLIKEYNVRVGIRNDIAAADRAVLTEYNQSTSQGTADKLAAVHDKLVELLRQQEAELNNTLAEVNQLAKAL